MPPSQLCNFIGIVVTLLAGLVSLPGDDGDVHASAPREITILHTNDIHGHLTPWRGWDGPLRDQTVGGFDRLSRQIDEIRTQLGSDRVLLLDAGDTIGDTMIAAETKGQAGLDAMNALRYDAMAPGNHEFDFGADTLRQRIAQARFPVLAANIVSRGGEPFTRPYLVRAVNGVQVGILGLGYPNTPLTTAPRNVEGLRFRDAAEAAREYVPRLRQEGATVIVALTHLGLAADKRLAAAVPGIDVIVGGHSHNRMTEAIREGQTLIVQAGAHGSDLVRLDLTIDQERITANRRTLIPLIHAAGGARDGEVADLLTRHVAPRKATMEAAIGRATSLIARAQTIAGQEAAPRNAESPADDLFADAIRETTGTEVAFLPGVGYGVAIHPGEITANQLRNLLPHSSAVWTMRLTGAQIRDVLEQSIENLTAKDPADRVGGIIQVSGLRFTYDRQLPQGERVSNVTVGGQPLDASRTYAIATNALLAQGGHNYRTFLAAADRREVPGQDQYEMVKVWIARRGPVDAPRTERIGRAERGLSHGEER